MTTPDELARAYAEARYRLRLPDGVCERRIGVIDAQADARLRAAGCRTHWHFITAHNPHSQPLPEVDNAARHAELKQLVARRGWRRIEALASDDQGDWPEPGFVLFDADEGAVRQLAERYGQNAIVRATLGGAPQLLWTAP